MDRIRFAETAFIATLAGWVLVTLFYYVQAPETIASHFDGSGRPNGWSSKNGFFGITLGMMALLAVVFLWLPRQRFFLNQKLSNLPNKQYWLAPERAKETWMHLREQLLWMGVATGLLEGVITTLAMDANRSTPPRLSSLAAWCLGAYFVFTAIWLFRLIMRFRRVPAESRSTDAALSRR